MSTSTFSWNLVPDGKVLVQTFVFEASDHMPKEEPTVLGGYSRTTDDAFYGWVVRQGKKLDLLRREKEHLAIADVETRLSELGYVLNPETTAEA